MKIKFKKIKKIIIKIIKILFILSIILYVFVFFTRNYIKTLSTFTGIGKTYSASFPKLDVEDYKIDKINFINSYGNNINGIFVNINAEETVYYFHGNGGPLPSFYNHIKYISDLGYNVMAYDYPGYGESDGFPDDEQLFSTSKEFYNYIKQDYNLLDKNINLWGYSAGSAVAVDFAYISDFNKLVLIAPISSRYDIINFYFGFNLLKIFFMPDSFSNKEKLKTISNPTLIIHGNIDKIIPFSGGQLDFNNSLSEEKYFIELDNFGHNGIIKEKGSVLKKYFKYFLSGKKLEIENNYLFLDSKRQLDLEAEVLEIENEKKLLLGVNLVTDSSFQKFVNNKIKFNDIGYVPDDLEYLDKNYISDSKGNAKLRLDAKQNFEQLSELFYKKFGKKIVVVSSYRSYSYQKGIKDRGCPDNLCAKAGYSEHQSGLALDLWEATTNKQFLSKSYLKAYYNWLLENAHEYGFHNTYQKGLAIDGYEIEPWHWRYVGVGLATYLNNNNMTIAEYYNTIK